MPNLVSENVTQLHAREQRWLVEHQAEYAGQWVALLGDSLLTHGTDARQVYAEARRKIAATDDAAVPLVVLIEAEPDLPFGGW
ncbi:MAG: DUF5678 domain-containing protein [Acidobacteriota bacterium]|nr:DUF5678 domain-containing protein [Acidobacteriota bacterium]